jgi:hypothetical protein
MKQVKLASLIVSIFFIGSLQAQTADEIVNKHIDAIGGKENWKKVNSLKQEANLSVQGMDIPLTMYQVNNKAMKQEFVVMNMTAYTIMRADSGWTYMPFQGQTAPEPMTAEQVKMGADQLDIQGELLDYAAKGHNVELQGKEDVDGTEAIKLKVTRKSGNEIVYYFDPSNYLVIRTVWKVKVDGQEMEQKMNYSNYQKLPEGITVPFTMESTTIPAPVNLTKVEVNPDIPESVFRANQ